MRDVRVLVLTDTHLSHVTPEAVANVASVVEHADRTAPDLVVHLGDVAVDGPSRPDDLVFARDVLAPLAAAGRSLHVIPGNHDIGDAPDGPDAPAHDHLVDAERLARWGDVFGADRWRIDVGAWSLVGVDAQLMGSGIDAEDEQWAWIERELPAAGADGRPVVLCIHKPLVLGDPSDPDGLLASRYVAPAPAERLLALARAAGVRLVLSGHVHQHRRIRRDGLDHVWVPTAWAVLPERLQPLLGDKVCAVAEVVLRADGSHEVTIVQPSGLEHHELGTTIVSPYARADDPPPELTSSRE